MDEWALRRHLEAPYVQLARRILHRCGIWSQGITVTVVIGTRKPRRGIVKDLPGVVAASTRSKIRCGTRASRVPADQRRVARIW